MIFSEEQVRDTIEEYLKDTALFLVELTVGGDGRIGAYIGGDNGVSVKNCEDLNRHLNEVLDNVSNDFELVVSTPGVGEPLKVTRQYGANIGRTVKVRRLDGTTLEGELTESDDKGFVVKTRKKERIEGRKSKQWVEEDHRFEFDSISETKVLVSFK